MMQLKNILVTLFLSSTINVFGQEVIIHVLDQSTHSGVNSDVFLIKNTDSPILVGETDASGILAIDLNCEIGIRIKAKPRDASYYHSREKPCHNPLELIVVRRPPVAENATILNTQYLSVERMSGAIDTYAVTWIGTVNPTFITTSSNDNECHIGLQTTYERQVHTSVSDSGWFEVALLEETLNKSIPDLDTFPDSCDDNSTLAFGSDLALLSKDEVLLNQGIYTTFFNSETFIQEDLESLVHELKAQPDVLNVTIDADTESLTPDFLILPFDDSGN